MAKTKDKVSDAADNVKPYVDRALHDEELNRLAPAELRSRIGGPRYFGVRFRVPCLNAGVPRPVHRHSICDI